MADQLPSTTALLEMGRKAIANQRNVEEKEKVGILRAGNTGALIFDGKAVGSCPRRVYLRKLGIEVEDTSPRALMFEAGLTNEDSIVARLKASGFPGLGILREEDTGIAWETDNGTKVTGRPDIVLQSQLQSVRGLELKLVCSLWTARDVKFKQIPKLSHLLQAGHYSWQLGIPFELRYTSRVDWPTMGFVQKLLPKEHPLIELNDKGQPKKILPFDQSYFLEWTGDGQLTYRAEDKEQATHTPITIDGIKGFYNMVASLDEQSVPPAAPININADGSDAGFNLTAYCPLGKYCCGGDVGSKAKTMGEWTDSVVSTLNN